MAESVTIQQARRYFESRPNIRTLRRWCSEGVLSRCGKRVKLETFVDGGRVYVSVEQIQEFKAKLNDRPKKLLIDA